MRQLAGVACVICGKPIPSRVAGRFCDVCGSPVHNGCMTSGTTAPPSQDIIRLPLREQEAATGVAEGDCPTCGARAKDIRRELELHRQDHQERIVESRYRGGLAISALALVLLFFGCLSRVIVTLLKGANQ